MGFLDLDEPALVFNFEVEDFHTYFVGELNILVHNIGCGNTQTMSVDELTPTHKITMGRNKFNKFVKQVDENGITDPIDYVVHEGKNYVVNGHHRLQAAKVLGID